MILGIDRFMSMFRGLFNMIGNGVATLVIARWENELNRKTLQQNLAIQRRFINSSNQLKPQFPELLHAASDLVSSFQPHLFLFRIA